MNKQKKPYMKPEIVFEDFRTGELTGTAEMVKKIKAENEENEPDCLFDDASIPCSVRSGSE